MIHLNLRYSDVSWKSFRERKTRDKIDQMNKDLPMEFEDVEERSCDDLDKSGKMVISIVSVEEEGDNVEILSMGNMDL